MQILTHGNEGTDASAKPTGEAALAAARCCAAPSGIPEVIRELNAHIENLERLNRIGVSNSIVNAIKQREILVAALCGAQHNVRMSDGK